MFSLLLQIFLIKMSGMKGWTATEGEGEGVGYRDALKTELHTYHILF